MEILFLPVLLALLTSSVAYGIAYTRTHDRYIAGMAVQRYAIWYAPLILLMLWPVFSLRVGHSGTQYIQFDNVPHDLFFGLCAGALLGHAGLTFANWVSRRYPGYANNNQRNIIDMIGLILITPVVEEVLFRGFGFEMSSPLGLAYGVLIPSLAFALWRMNPYLTAPAFLFGLVASGLYLYTQSLFAPIVAHMISNFAYWRWSTAHLSVARSEQ
ncbi:MAG: CPBP family intramembrane glutamic endopeptidase [Pseudomonadota bacterium]